MKSKKIILSTFLLSTLSFSSVFADTTTTTTAPSDTTSNSAMAPASGNSNTGTNMNNANTNTTTTTTNTSANTDANSQKEGEILAWLIVVDKSEMNAAKEALKKKVGPLVKKYAKMMQKDHSKNLKETISLAHKMKIKPIDSADDVKSLKDKSSQAMDKLKDLKKDEFAKAYIDDMVNGHNEALQKIDEDLKAVNNPKLKKQLELTRKVVERHLAMAKKIQDKLNSSSSTSNNNTAPNATTNTPSNDNTNANTPNTTTNTTTTPST